LKIDKGIFLTDAHMIQSSKVIVIGSEVVNTLFDGIDPIGKYLKISSNRFLIIGVMEEQDNTFGDQGINKTSYIPLNTMYESLSPPANLNRDLEIDWIMVKAIGSEEVSLAMAETAKMIRLNHRIVEEDDFLVTNQQEILESLEVITNAIIIFLTSIAAVSLLVGGIGIMNIMLVTVTERTREIGIRKALGATRYDILLQFVIESVLLTATGGLIGMLLGYGVSHLLNGIPIGDQFLTSSFTMEIAMLALSVSVSIGLFFGIFPAYRASKLHPIDALRYQ
jgi:putative ABC transport system permease protein